MKNICENSCLFVVKKRNHEWTPMDTNCCLMNRCTMDCVFNRKHGVLERERMAYEKYL